MSCIRLDATLHTQSEQSQQFIGMTLHNLNRVNIHRNDISSLSLRDQVWDFYKHFFNVVDIYFKNRRAARADIYFPSSGARERARTVTCKSVWCCLSRGAQRIELEKHWVERVFPLNGVSQNSVLVRITARFPSVSKTWFVANWWTLQVQFTWKCP